MPKYQGLQPPNIDLLSMTANIVAAYVSSNPLSAEDLPGVIQAVHDSLDALNTRENPPSEEPAGMAPAKRRRAAESRK